MDRADVIKKVWPAMIKLFEDPIAPMKMQQAYDAADKLGRMLATVSDRKLSHKYSEQMLSALGGKEELDKMGGSPEFILVLSAHLCTAIAKCVSDMAEAEDKGNDKGKGK